MNQLQSKQKKQDSIKNPQHHTSQSLRFSKAADHPYLQAQGVIGNHGILRRHNSDIIQAKLKIGQPNDKYELEADRVADQVMRMPGPEGALVEKKKEVSPLVQRKSKCPECMEEDDEHIQTKSIADRITPLVQRQAEEGVSPMTAGLQNQVQNLKGGGQHLPQSTRAFFESRFGADFSNVRVHTDSRAADTAKSVNARAFTIGRDVVFGAGQYTPWTPKGQRLLAHELTHTIQQNAGSNEIRNQMKLQRQAYNVKLNGCDKTPYNKEDILNAVKDVYNTVRTNDCIKSEDLRIDILRKFLNLTINCEQRNKGNRCGSVASRYFNRTIDIYPNALTAPCPGLRSTILHEVIHLTEFRFGGEGEVAYGCDKSCYGWGPGDASKCKKHTDIAVSLFMRRGTPESYTLEFRHFLADWWNEKLRPFIFVEAGPQRGLSGGVGATFDSFWLPIFLGGKVGLRSEWFRPISVGGSVEAGLFLGESKNLRLGIGYEEWLRLSDDKKRDHVYNFSLKIEY